MVIIKRDNKRDKLIGNIREISALENHAFCQSLGFSGCDKLTKRLKGGLKKL